MGYPTILDGTSLLRPSDGERYWKLAARLGIARPKRSAPAFDGCRSLADVARLAYAERDPFADLAHAVFAQERR